MALTPLARIESGLRVVSNPAPPPPEPRQLSPREKAAVIVRLLLTEGVPLQISGLPEHLQASLAQQMGAMRLIDRATVAEVIREFSDELEQVGLSFPGGVEAALTLMDSQISQSAASRLRRLVGASYKGDPWERLSTLPEKNLLAMLHEESTEVAAVMLSKLSVTKAAELLGKLPGERARRVAYAVSMTANVDPETVRRIGNSLAAQMDQIPSRAFDASPAERVSAILNISGAATREEVLRGLDETDRVFADQVRQSIFTFGHIPERLSRRDVTKVVRIVDQATLVTAFAAVQGHADLAPVAEHFLTNMSQRLSQGLREEIAARGVPREKEAEEAMNAVVLAIRQLEAAGEIILETEAD